MDGVGGADGGNTNGADGGPGAMGDGGFGGADGPGNGSFSGPDGTGNGSFGRLGGKALTPSATTRCCCAPSFNIALSLYASNRTLSMQESIACSSRLFTLSIPYRKNRANIRVCPTAARLAS
jgi:hypothetical protein